ncbi:MAG: 4-alpha-glucanotransferase, partial [Sphaerochaetaceae bacterium]
MNKKIRYSGVLLHPTCLPGGHGIGDMGEEAFRFVDMLADSSVGLWQILPL